MNIPFKMNSSQQYNTKKSLDVSNNIEKIQSAWWVIYMIDKKSQTPVFLLIKRQAMSKRIEWIAPKGKIKPWESPDKAAMREIQEETWLLIQNMEIKQKLDTISLQLYLEDGNLWLDKDITDYLIEYHWDPQSVQLQQWEWFLWQYVWTDIHKALNLITYRDLRELYRVAFHAIGQLSAKKNLIDKLF